MAEYHQPVLLDRVMGFMKPVSGGVYLDATLGGGGHSEAILKVSAPDGKLICIDRDTDALAYAQKRLIYYSERVTFIHSDFAEIEDILSSTGTKLLDGALFDLGVSSHQLDANRGFTFARDEKLDMRMNLDDEISARDIVNTYGEKRLSDIIWRYGEERFATRVARAIVRERAKKSIETTCELADIVRSAIPMRGKQTINPVTRTFQAIRIEVNHELESAERGIMAAIEALAKGGGICVISFHSLEDRIVKNIFKKYSGLCTCPPRIPICTCGAKKDLEIITSKPVMADACEVDANPRARSAKLRFAVKI